MRTRALAPFGMEAWDIDISAVRAADAQALRSMIAHNRVVVFRDQNVDDADLVHFLTTLGEMTFTPGETVVATCPDLNVVSNMGRSTTPRSVFHTDTSYVARPPALTALRAIVLPQAGGGTIFSDQVAALARMPVHWQRELAGRTLRHRVTGIAGHHEEIAHPLMRQHPLTGETSLYLSTPERCGPISDVENTLSARIVTALYRHSIRPAYLYRHAWRKGDMLIWDNRVTMHRADHNGVIGDRVLHRGMVLGEVPLRAEFKSVPKR